MSLAKQPAAQKVLAQAGKNKKKTSFEVALKACLITLEIGRILP